MNIPLPTNDEQQTKHTALLWAIADYKAMFPKPPKKSAYDLRVEHDMDLIANNPPRGQETQKEYYNRVGPLLSKGWFGRVVRDMGYERKSTRIAGRVVQVWKVSP